MWAIDKAHNVLENQKLIIYLKIALFTIDAQNTV